MSPLKGWVVHVDSPQDGGGRTYIVAIDDREMALAAVQKLVGHRAASLGTPVEESHFLRRKMKMGDVFELGAPRRRT